MRHVPSWNERANEIILSRLETLAERTMELHFERRSELVAQYNARQRAYYFRDTRHNLESLAASILLLTPEIFADHMAWVKELLEARNIPTGGLKMHLECMKDALAEQLPYDLSIQVGEHVDAGLQRLAGME